ncbi:MAG: hypothetical protein LRY71_00120 [Bacillaceae bacterium]|nr:hypothetical protein [Bacillaceae bacterium]
MSGYLLTNDEDVLESKIDNYYVNRAVYDKDKDEITVFISIKTEQKYRDEENLIQRLGVSDHQTYKFNVNDYKILLDGFHLSTHVLEN